jgi:hypothetical protein
MANLLGQVDLSEAALVAGPPVSRRIWWMWFRPGWSKKSGVSRQRAEQLSQR